MTAQQTQATAPQDSDLDPESLAAIRDLLASEPKVEPQPVAERIAEKKMTQQAPVDAVAAAPVTSRFARPAARKPEAVQDDYSAQPKVKAPKFGLMARLRGKVSGYRPTPKHIMLAALALLVVFRPWLVIGVLFISAFLLIALFLIVGYDGFWRRIMGIARWYAGRRPARAAELHRKLDAFAMKFDAFLDRFPEGSVDGLYLPDFGEMAKAEAKHDAALDRRFDSLRQTGA